MKSIHSSLIFAFVVLSIPFSYSRSSGNAGGTSIERPQAHFLPDSFDHSTSELIKPIYVGKTSVISTTTVVVLNVREQQDSSTTTHYTTSTILSIPTSQYSSPFWPYPYTTVTDPKTTTGATPSSLEGDWGYVGPVLPITPTTARGLYPYTTLTHPQSTNGLIPYNASAVLDCWDTVICVNIIEAVSQCWNDTGPLKDPNDKIYSEEMSGCLCGNDLMCVSIPIVLSSRYVMLT